MKNITNILIIIFYCISCNGQKTIDNYLGGWAGKLKVENPFLFDIELEINQHQKSVVKFKGQNNTTTIELRQEGSQYLVGQFDKQLTIRIDTSKKKAITFIQTGHHLSYIKLDQSETGNWTGKWDLLIGENIAPTIYLSLNKSDDGNYSASTFIKEPTFHYMFGNNFRFDNNEIEFIDIRSNIKFKGILENRKIDLKLSFLNEQTNLELLPLPYNKWEIGEPGSGSNTAIIEDKNEGQFTKLIEDISKDTLVGVHSILVSQNDSLIFERYFDGFTKSTIHDTRSLSKSFASSIIGIAIAKNKLENENTPIKTFFENQYPAIDWTNNKDSISIHHLLTMSSGLDAIDFGLNRMSYANESAYQNQADWTEHILTAPMINKPGKVAYYGSGNPHLLGPILNAQLDERLEFYIHKNLFQSLNTSNYRIQTDNKGLPYFGGGWYFTSRDLMSYGQLYLDNGARNNEQIISKKWVSKSMDKHSRLENASDKNEYGYLFWHKTYTVNNINFKSIEARGSGGQYIFIVPQHNLVVVITSGNYRNNKGFQPEKIMEEYILSEIVK